MIRFDSASYFGFLAQLQREKYVQLNILIFSMMIQLEGVLFWFCSTIAARGAAAAEWDPLIGQENGRHQSCVHTWHEANNKCRCCILKATYIEQLSVQRGLVFMDKIELQFWFWYSICYSNQHMQLRSYLLSSKHKKTKQQQQKSLRKRGPVSFFASLVRYILPALNIILLLLPPHMYVLFCDGIKKLVIYNFGPMDRYNRWWTHKNNGRYSRNRSIAKCFICLILVFS